MPVKKLIEPHKGTNHGRICWRVTIPKDMRGMEGKKVMYFTDKIEALGKCTQLMHDRDRVGKAFHSLDQQGQALLVEALRRVDNKPEKILEAIEGMTLVEKNSKPRLIEVVVAECLLAKEGKGLRKRSLSSLGSTIKQFAKGVGVTFINQVTPHEISVWLNGNGWKSATRKGYLTDVRTLFSFAIQRGYISTNPAVGVEMPMQEDRPPGIFEVKQVRRFLATCLKHDRGLLGYVCPILMCGVRPNESSLLTEDRVGDKLIEITGPTAKSRRRRFIPINPLLRSWLSVKGIEYGIRNPKRRLHKIRRIAKVPWPHDVLRHTFCSYALPRYGAAKTALWSAHSEQVLFAHYRERVKPEDVKEFWGLAPKSVGA